MKRRFSLRRASLNVGSFFVAVVLCYGLFVLASEKYPEPVSASSCSCEGREDCRVETFDIYEGDTARCAFYYDGTSCCVVPADGRVARR